MPPFAETIWPVTHPASGPSSQAMIPQTLLGRAHPADEGLRDAVLDDVVRDPRPELGPGHESRCDDVGGAAEAAQLRGEIEHPRVQGSLGRPVRTGPRATQGRDRRQQHDASPVGFQRGSQRFDQQDRGHHVEVESRTPVISDGFEAVVGRRGGVPAGGGDHTDTAQPRVAHGIRHTARAVGGADIGIHDEERRRIVAGRS